MKEFEYRRLDGMLLQFVSGQLESMQEGAIVGYSVTFKLLLDFTHFVHVANQYIPGYLLNRDHAIHPELSGLAYHATYNKFDTLAGNIHSSLELCRVFTAERNYQDAWSTGGLEQRLHKPRFVEDGEGLLITAQQDFRWENHSRPVLISDLPLLSFQWALELFRSEGGHVDPVVWLGYTEADSVEIEDQLLYVGQHYMDGKKLQFGEIRKDQILTAARP